MQTFSETTGNIASETALQRLGTAALIGGFVVSSIGTMLILLGVFTRRNPRAITSG